MKLPLKLAICEDFHEDAAHLASLIPAYEDYIFMQARGGGDVIRLIFM